MPLYYNKIKPLHPFCVDCYLTLENNLKRIHTHSASAFQSTELGGRKLYISYTRKGQIFTYV